MEKLQQLQGQDESDMKNRLEEEDYQDVDFTLSFIDRGVLEQEKWEWIGKLRMAPSYRESLLVYVRWEWCFL